MLTAATLPERSLPLYEQTYYFIRNAIAEGRYRPGTKLVELTLARDLRVSRTPVREALRQLVREGFLQVSATGGVCVRQPTPSEVAELYALRSMLEGAAAALVAKFQPQEDLQLMEIAVHAGKRADATGDVRGIVQANTAFHSRLVAAARSKRLEELMGGMETWMIFFRSNSLVEPVISALATAEHEVILKVILAGDSEQAEEITRAHVLRGGGRVVAKMTELEGGDAKSSDLYHYLSKKHEERIK